MDLRLASVACGALFVAACVPKATATPQPSKVQVDSPAAPSGADEVDGLKLTLSEGQADLEKRLAPAAAGAQKLSDAEAALVLKRLPPLEEGVAKSFAFRERSLPAPTTGENLKGVFPPPVVEALTSSDKPGPLEVVRFSPDGAVPVAPQVSVTFSQPMVAVTSHAALAAQAVPVKITPMPTGGTWRWIGTKTLLFEAGERLPMASQYQVEIPKGTKSAVGGVLAETKSWTFSTPAPRLVQKFPEYGPHPTDALIFLGFDQKVDPQAVLTTVKVKAGSNDIRGLRLATEAEIKEAKEIEALVKEAMPGRSVIVRASDRLPAASTITVTVGPGTPSMEGPRRTQKPRSFSFETYHPLAVVRHRCGWSYEECRPDWPFNIEFNNPLDAKAFSRGLVTIEPPIGNLRATPSWSYLELQGRTAARIKYKVTLSKDLKDNFGQTLGKDTTLDFQVGPARPQLSAAREGFVVLDPAAKGRYSVFSVNYKKLKVQLFKVEPKDFWAFAAYMQAAWRSPGTDELPGKRVFNQVLEVKAEKDQIVETAIDLGPALTNGKGQVIAIIEHLEPPPPHESRRVIRSWIQVTDIGLDAMVDNTELVGWATALTDGKAIPGAELRLVDSSSVATSDAGGLVRLRLPEPDSSAAPTRRGKVVHPSLKPHRREMLVAQKDGDTAILPESVAFWDDGTRWVKKPDLADIVWYVFDDRGMYRPKEEVHVKGWLRTTHFGENGDVEPLGDAAKRVSYKLHDARGNVVDKGEKRLNALGGFDLVLKLPDAMNLGPARLELEVSEGRLKGQVTSHGFEVQEFRRPEFEVSVAASDGPHVVGSSATATVTAAYYAGGGLPFANVSWNVTESEGEFRPPNREEFSFGTWRPWWTSWYAPGRRSAGALSLAGETDQDGKHFLKLDFERVHPGRATSVVAQASVTDVNRQVWSASATMLVHAALTYVGLRTERPFVDRGKPVKVEAIATDLDGKAVAGRRVHMRATRLVWTYEDGKWGEKEESPQNCEVDSQATPVSCTFATPDGGSYKIRAKVADEQGRVNESDLTVWVTGGALPPERNLQQEKLTLIPDRKAYQPGDTAEILLQSPFYPADGVMSLRRGGVTDVQHFTIDGPSTTLKVGILEQHIPNLLVQVDVSGSAPRVDDKGEAVAKLPRRPAYATGSLNLLVPPLQRTLKLLAAPRDREIEPGGETVIDVTLADAKGTPVQGGEVAVVVVDEAILALSGYKVIDPLTVFYAPRGPNAVDHHSRASLLLANPESLAAELARQPHEPDNGAPSESMDLAPGAMGGAVARSSLAMKAPAPRALEKARRDEASDKREPGGDATAGPIRVRSDFNPLALFAAEVPTDAQGKAQVKVKLPDNLTRYRVMAVAVSGSKAFGAAESTLTARLPLMVRPSPPRFLNYGDRFELSVVVQNQTDKALPVDVALRASNATLTSGAGQRVSVPAKDRVELRFPAAAVMPGRARFQIGAASGRWADAATVDLPVWTPATTEAFATYGEIDQGAIRQPVAAPPEVAPKFGGLEVETSSTAIAALTDAVLYLVSYPYECSEQVSARVLAIAALKDVLEAFAADGLPPKSDILAAVTRDVKKLQGMQSQDGGFGLWRRDAESWPHVTVQVTHALFRAKAKGFAVPPGMLEGGTRYLDDIEAHVAGWPWAPERRAVTAYALYVLHVMGQERPARARTVLNEAGPSGMPIEALGWLLPVLARDTASEKETATIRRYLKNRVSETAATAAFVTAFSDRDYLTMRSSRRADAVILSALVETEPKHDLIPKLVRGLLDHRQAGHWESTEENVFVLLALAQYFAKLEAATPDFVARAWLGASFAGEHAFKGRTTERFGVDIPMSFVAAAPGTHDLVIGKEGPGRLYYRVGMRYSPKSLKLEAADHGFTVLRTYEAVDAANDVRRDEDGTWRVKAGAKVRVKLTMVAPSRRYHVALVDELPAGLEPMNPALKVTGHIPVDVGETGAAGDEDSGFGRFWWWFGPWYEHQNMRDERVEAFASLLWDGVHAYSYVARATTPGTFVVPPAKAEEMYHPETFGRTASDKLVVE